jgi:thiol-disulfide isomerase/thioredoxin
VEGIRKAIAERRGVPLLVNFWAVWCDPCVEELPDLAHLEMRFARSRIRVLGVSCDLLVEDDSPEVRRKVAETLRRASVSYPNLLYSGSETPLIKSFQLPGPIPVSILYAPDGSELRRWTGRLPLGELKRALEHP